jgi:signal transduction histidine kinase
MTSGGAVDGGAPVAARFPVPTAVASALRALACAAAASVAWACGAGLPAALAVGGLALAAAFAGSRSLARGGRAAADGTAEVRRTDAARRLALELAADRAAAVLDSLREGVLVVDGAGEVVFANPEARRALGDPGRPPIGRTLWDVLPQNLADAARQAWELVRGEAGPDAPSRSSRFSAIAQGDRFYDLEAVRVRSRTSGHDFGTAFLLIDTTRNHELAQLKDRFLSSVSHELRTPLANVCAFAEILRHHAPGDGDEWPEFVRIVHDESVQLRRIVEAVFDYLQLESGDATFELRPVDGVAVARASCDSRRERARELGVELEFCHGDAVPPIEADHARFEQVCDHLLTNGLKFTPHGGKVRVSASMIDGHFCLRVDDSGPGVPGSERQSVFDKFHQLHDHLTEKPSGAGLGLATSRVIVSRLGGVIWCEQSELGGAAFVVVLPVVGGPRLQPIDAVGSGAF